MKERNIVLLSRLEKEISLSMSGPVISSPRQYELVRLDGKESLLTLPKLSPDNHLSIAFNAGYLTGQALVVLTLKHTAFV